MPQRLVALDVLRGLTVALMILVNNPGSWSHVLPPLRHAAWHGCTPTDLVFPFFLFSVGASMSLSFSRRRAEGDGRRRLVRKVLTRAGIIFALGLLLNAFPFGLPLSPSRLAEFQFTDIPGSVTTLRVFGVLQRIAVAYLLAGFVVTIWSGRRSRLLIGGGLVCLYEVLMRMPLVADWGAGSFAREDNFARWLDLRLLGEAHLYRGAGLPFDPEGLVSSLPAAVTVLAGYCAGEFLRHKNDAAAAVKPLALAGVIAAALGLLATPLEPLNKQLWTVSYTLFTGGLGVAGLALCLWAIDVRGWRSRVAPAVVFGANPLVAFVGSGLLARLLFLVRVPVADGREVSLKHLAVTRLLDPWAGAELGSLLFALANVGLWLAILTMLHRRGVYLRI